MWIKGSLPLGAGRALALAEVKNWECLLVVVAAAAERMMVAAAWEGRCKYKGRQMRAGLTSPKKVAQKKT